MLPARTHAPTRAREPGREGEFVERLSRADPHSGEHSRTGAWSPRPGHGSSPQLSRSASSGWQPCCAQPAGVPPWMASRIVGSAPSSRSVSTASRLAGLRGEMEGGHALAVVRPAEGAARVHVGAELDEAADRRDAPVRRRPGQRRAAVRIGIEVGAELDEPLDRLDAIALRGPHERLVEDLLRIVGRLPGGKAAVRAVEAAVRARCRRAGELVDQVDEPEPGRDTQVARLEPEHVDDLAMAPEERGNRVACRRRRARRGRCGRRPRAGARASSRSFP